MTWREFGALVGGLLASDTRLSRHFTLPPDLPGDTKTDPEVSERG